MVKKVSTSTVQDPRINSRNSQRRAIAAVTPRPVAEVLSLDRFSISKSILTMKTIVVTITRARQDDCSRGGTNLEGISGPMTMAM